MLHLKPNSNIALTDSARALFGWGRKKGVFETFLLRKTCPNVPVIAPQKAALQPFPWSMPNTNKAALKKHMSKLLTCIDYSLSVTLGLIFCF